ncbi:hypothetical protein FLW53_28525 [Microbispora sp. SCL1-1]|uniref:hypothetical protein n=1 Tax=unclassified Microbispora TaxID=2614687 RepID=UPI00115B2C9C|nr:MULTISPECIES: hypothetical protein [unclassified Microbispora]NJP28076.1 hypothetical protein [Microbispora sp. CL1-1]TQS09435.1 hypothetical protein FLW53_28525 [Microbispora sp. SCL1-1]
MPPDTTKGGAPAQKRRPARSAAHQAAHAHSVRHPRRPGMHSLAECVVEVLVDLAAIRREGDDEQGRS